MHIVYSQSVVEFVAVATETCLLLEQHQSHDRDDLVAKLLKLLPLLYTKAQLLPEVDGADAFSPESYVSESDYEWLRMSLAETMGEIDEFEDTLYDEGVQTGELRWRNVSECLADIYQPVRNFVETYRAGMEENTEEALWAVRDTFELYWGADLVDVLRRLHRVTYIDQAGA